MSASVHCSHCGAPFRAESEHFCAFCGVERPAPAVVQVAPSLPVTVATRIDDPARFEAAELRPELAPLMERVPEQGTGPRTNPIVVMFLVFWTLGAFILFLLVSKSGSGALSGLFALFPAFGAILIVALASKHMRFATATVDRALVMIVDERNGSEGGARSVNTVDRVLLQRKDGKRNEVRVDKALAGLITRGDLGVAYVKGGYLVDFQRLQV